MNKTLENYLEDASYLNGHATAKFLMELDEKREEVDNMNDYYIYLSIISNLMFEYLPDNKQRVFADMLVQLQEGTFYRPCLLCNGSGQEIHYDTEDVCEDCLGSGTRDVHKRVIFSEDETVYEYVVGRDD